jgi:hypothetical protein
MLEGETVRSELTLAATQYLSAAAQVKAESVNMGKTAQDVFARLDTAAQKGGVRYQIFGDETRRLASTKRALEAAINRLINLGYKPESDELQKATGLYKQNKEAIDKLETGHKGLKDTFASLRDVMQGPIAAGKEIINVIKDVVRVGSELYMEYAQAEKAALVFNKALEDNGTMAYEAEKRLTDYAKELQKNTIYEDDNTIALMSNLAAQGKQEEQIKKIIEAASNYASATGIDMDTAVKQLSSTLSGSARELGRQSIEIKNLTKEELEAGKAIDIVNRQYKDQAEIVGGSALGATKKLENAMGDLRETMGQVIATNFQPMVENIKNTVSETTRILSSSLNIADVVAGKKSDRISVTQAMDDIKKGMADIASGKVKDAYGQNILYSKQLKQIEAIYSKNQLLWEAQKNASDLQILADKILAEEADKKAKEEEESANLYAYFMDKRWNAWNSFFTKKKEKEDEGFDYSGTIAIGTWSEELAKSLAEANGSIATHATYLDRWERAIEGTPADPFYSGKIDIGTWSEELSRSLAEANGSIATHATYLDKWELAIENTPAEPFYDGTIGIGTWSEELAKSLSSANSAISTHATYLDKWERAAQNAPGDVGPIQAGNYDDKYERAKKQALAIRGAQVGLLNLEDTYRSGIAVEEELIKANDDLAYSYANTLVGAFDEFGAALVAGEDGWKLFAKAGLNAFASLIEASAQASDVMVAEAVAASLIGTLGGIPASIAYSLLAHTAAAAIRAIPMAKGGSGVTNGPTVFLAGESGSGREPFAFGNSVGGGGTMIYNDNRVIQNVAGSIRSDRELRGMAVGAVANAGRGY